MAMPDVNENQLGITVRTANVADFETIIDVWRSSGMVTGLNDPSDDLQFALAGPASTVLVAEDETRRIVGTVMVGHDGHRGNLYYLAVAPRFRLRGVGRRLVKAAECWLREAGVRKIHILVLTNNVSVKPFYEKLGYGEAPAVLLRKWSKATCTLKLDAPGDDVTRKD